MKECIYHLDIDGFKQTFNSDKELSDFVKKRVINNKDVPGVKFSLTSAQLATWDDLSNIPKQVKAGENITVNGKSVDVKSDRGFIHSEHMINNKMKLLSLFFSKDNYEVNLLKDIRSNPDKYPETLVSLSDEELLKQIKLEVKLDNKMLDISKKISFITTVVLNNNSSDVEIYKMIDDLLDLVNDYNKSDEKYTTSDKRAILEKIKGFTTTLSNFGDLKSGVKITTKSQEVNSNINAIANGTNGKVNLFKFAITRNKFSGWNQAKKVEMDYLLGLQRQILNGYTKMSQSSLFIAPIIIPETDGKLNIKDLLFDSLEDRSGEKQFGPNGTITTVMNTLLPVSAHKSEIINDDINNSNIKIVSDMFGKYEIKSQMKIENVENLYEKGILNGKDLKRVYIYDYLVGGDTRIEEEKTPGWEERFKNKLIDYVARYNDSKTSKLQNLVKAIDVSKKSGDKTIKLYEKDNSIHLNKVFGKYLDPDWDMIAYPQLLNVGVIVFRNFRTSVLEAVSVTANDLKIVYHIGMGTTVLGKFSTDQMVQNDSKIMNSSGANIESLKVIAILNNMPNLFSGGLNLGAVYVYNQINDSANFSDVNTSIYNFSKISKKLNVVNNFESGKIKRVKLFNVVYSEILSKSPDFGLGKILKGIGSPSGKEGEDRIKWFKDLQKSLINNYPELKVNVDKIPDYSNPIFYINALISEVISEYNKIGNIFDYDVPRYGIRKDDILHMIKSMFSGEPQNYDKDGNVIVGLLQGSSFSTSDTLPSKGLGELNNVIAIAQNQVVSDFSKSMNRIKNKTISYYEAIGRGNLSSQIVGDADKYHEVFYKKDEKNRVSKEMLFLNPYDTNATLNTTQRDYLKFVLYELYKHRTNNANSKISLSDFEKSEIGKKEIDKVEIYLQVPLVRKMGLTTWKTLTTDKFWSVAGRYYKDVKASLNPDDLTLEQRNLSMNAVNDKGIHMLYDRFDISPDFRLQQIEAYGVGNFEINLDTIAIKYAMSKIKQKQMNAILPGIEDALTVMKYHSWKTGHTEELQKALEDFWKQLQISVYDRSILEGEEIEDVMSTLKWVQQKASICAIALRPMLTVKELLVGTVKNVSFAWSKVYGEDSFNGKNLAEAYKILFMGGTNGNLLNEHNLIDAFNLEYRFANMDLNNITDKTKLDRRGMNFLSEHLFWTSTCADYTNRLSLFIAKMLHDGTYNAHSLDSDGNLVYDPSKDMRFEYYFKNRVKNNYQFSESDNKYNDQRSLYLTIMEEFNSERRILNLSNLEERDNIPRAYTNKDRDSIKEFSDTAYGYYDHERSPLIKHSALGITFGQFITFWPAKVKYYFGKGGTNTKKGYFGQKYKLDENQNKVYYWLKTEYNEDGEAYTYETTENTGNKAQGWVGSYSEGLLYSLGYCIKDLKNGNLTSTDPQRKRRAMLALHDLLLGILLLKLASLMIYGVTSPSKADREALSYGQQYASKIMMNSMLEFDPLDSVFNTLKWTPASLSIMSNALSSFDEVISGDDKLSSFFRDSFKALEVIPKPMK